MLVRPSRFLGALVALSLLAACGSDDGESSASSAAPADSSAADSTVAGSDTSAPEDSTADSAADPAATDPAATDPAVVDTVAPNAVPKPEVELPAELPTELVVTDLTTGSGPKAKSGDTVVVHYVGVRSEDGTEFDNSYDRGQPFPVTLGTGSVIQGWDEGLVGTQAGARRQLDIPADLAYGDQPQGDIIKAGDALSFVVDVLAVIPPTDAADAPTVTITGGDNVSELVSDDLVTGEGDDLAEGQNAAVHIIAFRADNGEQIDSTWEAGAPISLVIDPAQLIPGLAEGLVGMKVGGRRQLTIPYVDAFGEAGNPDMGLPEKIDLVVVVDLFAIY